jgi:GT2 family glycosyltransferase
LSDLRSWTTRAQIAKHPVAIGEIHVGDDDADRVPPQRKLGFTAVIPAPTGQMLDTIYLVDVDTLGLKATLYGPAVLSGWSSEQEGVRLVHEAFGPIQALPSSLIPEIYHPVLARPRGAARARRFEFGPPLDGATPLTSIIIPFYGDAFFLNCVFYLQRVLGPGFELIIVVDDPRIWPEVYGRLSASTDAITVPTVLLECDQNYGYARANNLGATAARGDVLVLMNSDVMVLSPAMLANAATDIRTRREAHDPEAIIGFSLLYEDDTIQHVGMVFPQSRLMGGLRMADHPSKGLPFALYESPDSRQVTAVTGALMALSASLFEQLGGFDPAFERGDFEDADLCLRARQMGAEIWLHSGPGLYHLERQSIRQMSDSDSRDMITYMNCVTFNERWNAAITAQARSHDNLPAAAPTQRRPVKLQSRNPTSVPSGNLRSANQKTF